MSDDVAVVFVNYRSHEMIEPRAMRLLEKGVPVLVADNSGDFGAPGIPSIPTGGNVGFGTACNMAIATLPSSIRTVCLHNPDVDLEPEAVVALAELVTPGTGALAPAIATGGAVRERGFHYPTPAREAYVACRALRGWRGGAGLLPPASRRRAAVGGRGRRFGTAALLVVAATPLLRSAVSTSAISSTRRISTCGIASSAPAIRTRSRPTWLRSTRALPEARWIAPLESC